MRPRTRSVIVWLRNDAEEISPRIFEDNEVRLPRVPPRIAPCAEFQQALDFGLLIQSVEIEMNPTAAAWMTITRLKSQIRTPRGRVAQHNPIGRSTLAWHVTKSRFPEGDGPIELWGMFCRGASLY